MRTKATHFYHHFQYWKGNQTTWVRIEKKENTEEHISHWDLGHMRYSITYIHSLIWKLLPTFFFLSQFHTIFLCGKHRTDEIRLFSSIFFYFDLQDKWIVTEKEEEDREGIYIEKKFIPFDNWSKKERKWEWYQLTEKGQKRSRVLPQLLKLILALYFKHDGLCGTAGGKRMKGKKLQPGWIPNWIESQPRKKSSYFFREAERKTTWTAFSHWIFPSC